MGKIKILTAILNPVSLYIILWLNKTEDKCIKKDIITSDAFVHQKNFVNFKVTATLDSEIAYSSCM